MKAGGAGVLVVLLVVGAGCVWIVDRVMTELASPELSLRLVPRTGGRDGRPQLLIRFINTGGRDIALPVGCMEYFIHVPDDASSDYRVHIQDCLENTGDPFPARDPGSVVILPGGNVDVGDVYPLIRNLPAGPGTLTAVYSAQSDFGKTSHSKVWRGVVRSPALPLVRRTD